MLPHRGVRVMDGELGGEVADEVEARLMPATPSPVVGSDSGDFVMLDRRPLVGRSQFRDERDQVRGRPQ